MALLTDLAIRRAKTATKTYTLKDGAGLFLNIKSNGTKHWLFRFYWQGQQKRISFGVYPGVDLKKARSLRQQAQDALANGIDPRENRGLGSEPEAMEAERGITFAKYAETWKALKLKKLGVENATRRQNTRIQIERYLRIDLLPALGKKPLAGITRADVIAVQRKIEKRGALSIAEKCRSWLNELFRYAMAEGIMTHNPAADMDIVALPYRRIRHNPHLTMNEMPELMGKLHHAPATRQTILGVRLLLLTGVRTGEMRFASPEQFDLEHALWRIPPENVKQLQRATIEKGKVPDYLVPLSRQAIEVIKELLSYKFPGQRYLFCHRSEPRQVISENTFNMLLQRLGFKDRLTGHGIRATLSTALNELGYNKDWIEAQLSHSDKDKIRGAYNHAAYIEQRRRMMQDWADKLDAWEEEGKRLLELKQA